MEFSCKNIDEKLRNKFQTHKYELSNSYIFSWESDFFSISKSGYSQEIEIKLTYSDFKADFSKVSKHNLLKAAFNNKKLYTEFVGIEYDVTALRFDRRNGWEEVNYKSTQPNKSTESAWKKKGYTFENKSSILTYSQLTICPNKFYYICPTGIIPLEEVPEYAGLYYISKKGRITEKKKAPFVHKEKQDLTQILLDKFYWKYKNTLL